MLLARLHTHRYHGSLYPARWGYTWELCGVCQSFCGRVHTWEDGGEDDQDAWRVSYDNEEVSHLDKEFMLRLKGINCCNLVDLYEHNLQSGSRAFRWPNLSQELWKIFYLPRDGADAETVVCALFHDVGEVMSPVCHGEIGNISFIFDLVCNIVFQRQVYFGPTFLTRTSGYSNTMRSCPQLISIHSCIVL